MLVTIPVAASLHFAYGLARGDTALFSVAAAFVLAVAVAKLWLPSQFAGRDYALRGVWLCAFVLDFACVGAGTSDILGEFRAPMVAAHTARRAATDKVVKLQTELNALPATDNPAVIAAALRTARIAAGSCTTKASAQSELCRTVGVYERAEAAAGERTRLAVALEAAQRHLDNLPSVTAYPEAASVARNARMLGLQVDEERVSAGMLLFVLALTDFGSIVLFRKGMTAGPRRQVPRPDTQLPKPSVSRAAPATEKVMQSLRDAAAGHPAPYMKERGGRVALSQRVAAKALGMPQRQYTDALAELAAANKLAYEAGPQGTLISLTN